MAKADTVYSMFGMKTPQQVAQEQLKRQQAFITRSARDPYQLAGASLGVALGRLFGGPSKEIEQAQEAEEVMRNFNEFGAEVEKEASERGMAPLDEVQMLNKRANELQAMSNRFSALGQPQDVVQNMSNEALKTRFLALDKQREMQKFEQDQQKYQLDMQVSQERLEQLQERDKLTPMQWAEIQLKSTPESVQEFLAGTGPLVPNPKMSSDVNKVIQTFEYYMNLPPEKQKQFLMVKRAVPIVDTGASVSFRNPADPTQEVLNIPKEIPPAQTPEAKATVKEAEVTTEAVTKDKLAAPGQIMALDMFDTQLADLAGHPGFQNAFGFGGEQLSAIPGSPAFGAASLLEQVKGSAFLNAIPQMKGLGALSDAEGRAITQSVTRLQQGLAPEEAKAEINKMRRILGQQRSRIESKQFLTPEQVRNMPLAIPQQRSRTVNGNTYRVIQ
jgi:hypothetical protein